MEEVPFSLSNFIKYCLGYVKLTRQRSFMLAVMLAVELPENLFNLKDLLESDVNDGLGKLINLETFYKFDPKKIPREIQKQYNKEKFLAKKIEEIYNKGRNNPYTKQIVFNFGYYEIEIPSEEKAELRPDYLEEEEIEKPSKRIDQYPLFSIPINIEKTFEKGAGKYFIKPSDTEIKANIEILADVLGEGLYYKLVEELGEYERKGSLSLPITKVNVFNEIWDKIRAQLKLTNAKFDEHSFNLSEMQIGISPRMNYFIADDLQKLFKFEDTDFGETSLTGWIEDEGLSVENEIPGEGDLYFPLSYDKHQLKVLSVIDSKMAIVQGPPGTGKSQTISNILCHLSAKGKKILFVSQSDQALKIVKDMLKKLQVKYLFGYIPDIGSIQLSEEDILDGIAPQLAALEPYIEEELGYKFYQRRKLVVYNDKEEGVKNEEIYSITKDKKKLKDLFNKSIDTQRDFWKPYQDLKELKEYDIRISNTNRFQNAFSNDLRKEIKDLMSNIKQVSKALEKYKNYKPKPKFDKLFSTLNLRGNHYSKYIQEIVKDISKFGYDGHSKILRFISNSLHKWKFENTYSSLPREITDYIKECLKKDTLRAQVQPLKKLSEYCEYFEKHSELQKLKNELKDSLDTGGLSEDEFSQVESLIAKANFNEIKERILRAAEIHKELKKLKIKDSNEINSALNEKEKTRQERVVIYLRNIINKKIIDKLKEGDSAKTRAIVRKLDKAFAKSKKAYKTFDRLREDPNNFLSIMDFVPVWVMKLDDASRIIPLKPAIFDYVIFDESSQCNIAYAMPAMYRAKKALFVGDSEQMRDNTIIFKSNRSFDELAKRYQISKDFQIKATGEAVQSILDIARLRGCKEITLRNHYRSPNELIGFSNKYFYKPKKKELIIINSNYLTYSDTNRIMIIHPVKVDWNKETSDRKSVSEAEEILKFFRELKSDRRYESKSIGILSFFNTQAAYIRELFEKEGYKEENDNYKIGIIEGIQGDEKDIIIYSFVIQTPEQKNKYVPLTGEGGDIRADINKGRVNVAFSRARLQTHCFVSMLIEEIPNRIWIKKYLEYAQNNGEIQSFSKLNPFDSQFEEEFYNFIRTKLSRRYRIQNQIENCGFKIDFVVSNIKTGKKIAIECDGPTHFSNEIDEEHGIYIEDDEERQRILEAAGWDFYRIKYSDWINENFDRNLIIGDISKKLSQ